MKKLLTLLALIFTVMFSSTSFGGWTKVSEGVGGINRGNTFYVDFERIRKHDGYVYYWRMSDYLKPTINGHFSDKVYIQGDCKSFGIKFLNSFYHREPMGEGTTYRTYIKPDNEWRYVSPNSILEIALNFVCEYAN